MKLHGNRNAIKKHNLFSFSVGLLNRCCFKYQPNKSSTAFKGYAILAFGIYLFFLLFFVSFSVENTILGTLAKFILISENTML